MTTVRWSDGRVMGLEEAIKWARLAVALAPNFPKYRETLDLLLDARCGPLRRRGGPIEHERVPEQARLL